MKFSVELDWKEVLALVSALLIGIGAGVVGTDFIKHNLEIPSSVIEYQK